MRTSITVREYARLVCGASVANSLDEASIPATAFDWLCVQNARISRSGVELAHLEDRRSLRLDNFVGVVETPCGTRIEILPKHFDEGDSVESCRHLLRRMILNALNIQARQAGPTTLQTFSAPLSEWVVSQFLSAVDHLLKRGLRSTYVRVEASERYMRGQLNAIQQMRRLPGQQHKFDIRHDVFVLDRPENRLIKSALEQICRESRVSTNWRLANELRSLLQDIPRSADIATDFEQWSNDRLIAHYQPVKPWCELLLSRQTPLSLSGKWQGISMLFPMERLFERFVASALRKALPPKARLTTQAASEYLCTHNSHPIFRLEPDLLIEHNGMRWVLDTKWKRINANDRANNYGISQGDMYQLHAYGQKYLSGSGHVALVYPKSANFDHPLSCFHLTNQLKLWVLPFNLDTCQLIHNGEIPSLSDLIQPSLIAA